MSNIYRLVTNESTENKKDAIAFGQELQAANPNVDRTFHWTNHLLEDIDWTLPTTDNQELLDVDWDAFELPIAEPIEI